LAKNTIFMIEILLIIIALILGILWFMNPAGNYEPSIVIIGLLVAIIDIVRRRKNLKEAPHSVVTQEHIDLELETKSTKVAVSNLSIYEIIEQIRNVPPFQKKHIEEQFVGLKVDWIGYLKYVSEDPMDKTKIRVNLLAEKGSIVGENFWFSEEVENFPEVKMLHEDSAIRVVGIIESTNGSGLCANISPDIIEVLNERA